MTQTEALLELQQLGFNVIPESNASDTVDEGRVIGTKPPIGDKAEDGAVIIVYVSLGAEAFSVPSVVGFDLVRATELLEKDGLAVGTVQQEPDDEVPAGEVVSQDPAAGEDVAPGDRGESGRVDRVGGICHPRRSGRPLRGRCWLHPRESGTRTGLRDGVLRRGSRGLCNQNRAGRWDNSQEGGSGDGLRLGRRRTRGRPELDRQHGGAGPAALEALGLVIRVNATTVEVAPEQHGLVVDQLPAAGVEVEPGTTISVTLGEAPPTTTTETTTTSP